MSDDSFHDYTRFGEMEFLISEFNKLESSLSNAEVSFVFREQIFCVSLIKKYTNKDYTSSLGHLGYPESDLSLLFWRAFDPFCEEVLLIFPKGRDAEYFIGNCKDNFFCLSLQLLGQVFSGNQANICF